MAISFRRYIDITSGIGAGVRVPGRELIGRIFTPSNLVPTDTVVEFEEAADVAAFFGSSSEEYRRAAFYFGWVSKTQVRPRKIGFCRHAPSGAQAQLRGRANMPPLDELKRVQAGNLALTIDGDRLKVPLIDLSISTSYADVAARLEAAIRAAAASTATSLSEDFEEDQGPLSPVLPSPLWSNGSVRWSAEIGAFVFEAGAPGPHTISPAEDLDDIYGISSLLRWSADSGVLASAGKGPTDVLTTLNDSADADNNFGAFAFLGDLAIADMAQAGEFAHLSNMGFIYCQGVTAANMGGVSDALKGYDGVALTEVDPLKGGYPDMIPMTILAATDYSRLNGSVNYMFTQFGGLAPTVSTNARANQLDDWRINYYGRTQQAGQLIDFYQRGVLTGTVQDMNVYANEMWLKDACGAALMTLLLSLPKISANARGLAQVRNALVQEPIAAALKNGVISVEKALAWRQKAFIAEVTGDDLAWVQVQTKGYWLGAEVKEVTVDDRIEYRIAYLLVYAKDDLIRKVEGTHSLI